MQEGQRDIYYLSAPSRALAELSPYQEGMKKKDVEVLFCYEPYDELVLLQLRQFQKFQLTSVEKVLRDDKSPDDSGKSPSQDSRISSRKIYLVIVIVNLTFLFLSWGNNPRWIGRSEGLAKNDFSWESAKRENHV